MARLLCLLALCLFSSSLIGAQVTIIDSGSTNRPGMNVKLKKSGPQAMIEKKDGSQQAINLEKTLCSRLMQDLKAAGPLNQLPAAPCMKSVSFGTSLFIEYKGVRSPDLNCPQTDPRSQALKQDAMDLMAAAKTQTSPDDRRFR